MRRILRKYHLFLFVWIFVNFGLCYHAQNREIKFEKGTFKNALAKAKTLKKILFVNCSSEGCGPCVWAKKKTFTNDTVADFYNTNFVNFDIDVNKGEGVAIAKKYLVKEYPTKLYLNAEGQLLHRVCGAGPMKYLIEDGKSAMSDNDCLAGLEKRYNNGNCDPTTAFNYFFARANACFEFQKYADKYLFKLPDSTLLEAATFSIVVEYASYNSKAFKYVEKHLIDFKNKFGSDALDNKINAIYAPKLNRAFKSGDMGTYKMLKKQFLSDNTKDKKKIIDRAELIMEKQLNRDLMFATEIEDSIVGPLNVSLGFGKIKAHFSETNSAWFKLNIGRDTMLTFDIVPVDSLDDYDFFIFSSSDLAKVSKSKYTYDTCIRSCRSICFSKSGLTGLSKYAADRTVRPGPGPAYASALPVKAGEVYYLLVDFPDEYTKMGRRPLGFSIYFYNYWPKRYPILLNDVYFESNNAKLLAASFKELDQLVLKLSKNYMAIEVRGHTDNVGTESENQLLSEQRAESVVNYLKSKGIKANRLFLQRFW